MEWIAFKAILSLVFVLLLMGVVLFLLKKFMFGKNAPLSSGIEMKVIGSLSLQPKKNIVILKVLNKYFIIGVTDNAIQPISEISDSETLLLLSNYEQSKINSSKHFSEYFTEYLGFIGWKGGKRMPQNLFDSPDVPKHL